MTSQEKIDEIVSQPFQFSVRVEYDREVVIAILYNNWINQPVITSREIISSSIDPIDRIYEVYKEVKHKE